MMIEHALWAAFLIAAAPISDFEGASIPPGRAVGPSGAWEAVLAKTQARGEFRDMDGNIPANFGLADIRGPKEADHDSDYVNVWGYGTRAYFRPRHATLVSEAWRVRADGHWSIDQWILWVDLDGVLTRALHQVIIETRDRTVLEVQDDPLTPGDPRISAKFEALVRQWEAYR